MPHAVDFREAPRHHHAEPVGSGDEPGPPSRAPLVVAIVCDSASESVGGEAILPLHYFRHLRQRGVSVWLITHGRWQAELAGLFGDDPRIRYVPDSIVYRALWRAGRSLPATVGHFTFGLLSRLLAQAAQRRIVRRLVESDGVTVVHQPTPVSPSEPLLLRGMGVPVVVGPMNGGMTYPCAFRAARGSLGEGLMHAIGRWTSPVVHRLWSGKLEADALLVANERSRAALPRALADRAIVLPENGVDLGLWRVARRDAPADSPVRLAFVGRLVRLKAVDLLLKAFFVASRHCRLHLTVIGDGAERSSLERQWRRAMLDGHGSGEPPVRFTGWLPQIECAEELARADILVMPSLHDCGGAVMLEAMASGLPVIATAWGGALDYIDRSCGVLVEPSHPLALVDGLAAAMVRLARSPQERLAMGRAGRRKVERLYDWERKIDQMTAVYHALLDGSSVAGTGRRSGGRRARRADASPSASHRPA